MRKLLSSEEGVYEAVNAEALSKTFIGLHNDATFKLTAPYAAFTCFKRATSGGEFLLCDGRQVLRELDGWHESSHLLRWSKSFELEAELHDGHALEGIEHLHTELASTAQHQQTADRS